METRWLYVTSHELAELREKSQGICVIPMGCVEKHGPHLPLGTDIIQASGIAYEASKMETFTVFPDFTFGDYPCNSPFRPAGSITLKLETEILLLEEMCQQISRNGFRKILVYNYHGGNVNWLEAFLRKLCNKEHDYMFAYVSARLPVPNNMAKYLLKNGSGSIPELTKEDEEIILKKFEENYQGGHACMGEIANILALAPESVHPDRYLQESGKSAHETDCFREARIHIAAGGWDVDYPNNYSGDDPTGVNERMGKASVRMEAEGLAKAVRVIKADTNWEKWHEKYWL